jgi:hypothetical protein
MNHSSTKASDLKDGDVVQGDGSQSHGIANLAQPKLYVVHGGRRQLIPDLWEFQKAGHERTAVKIIPDAELERVPLASEMHLAPGGQIALDLDTFLGAGHYMTTHGMLRKTTTGGHADATTRTRTITMFGGFHGGVNMIYGDAEGIAVGMSDTQRYGVDGTWIGRSDRTDYWSQDLSEDWASRTTNITLAHFWLPDRLDDVVRRYVDMAKPIVEIIQAVVSIGGGAQRSP